MARGSGDRAGLKPALHFAPLDQIVTACRALLDDDAGRRELEERGHRTIAVRDVRPILARALSETE